MKHKLFILTITILAIACSKDETLLINYTSKTSNTKLVTLKSGVNNISGFNWADARDNFVDGWVIPSGLTSGDNYSTVQSKANTILSGFQNVGANTVRLPINPSTVLESWWSSYKGAIDIARSKGMMVVLGCWESASSRDGLIDDMTEFWDMWDLVISDYEGNSGVYFEVFNEPHGYSTSDLISLYNNWLNRYPDIPRNRIVLGGSGYSENVGNIGGYFSNCLLSQHLYAWWGSHTTISAWENELADRIGGYESRTILTEFGAPMTTGKDYSGAINGDAEIAFIQGMASYCRNYNLASIYWPGLRDGDTYSLFTYNGSMNLTNSSGLEKIQYGWGMGEDIYYRITNRNSGKVLEVEGQSTSDGANVNQWSWWGGNNQQWLIIDLGSGYYRIMNRNSGKDLDVEGQSTSNGANVSQWTWWGGYNQQWQIIDNGNGYYRIINRNSGKALEVEGQSTSDGANVDQWSWWGGNNQQWQVTEL